MENGEWETMEGMERPFGRGDGEWETIEGMEPSFDMEEGDWESLKDMPPAKGKGSGKAQESVETGEPVSENNA